jgi:HAD superfamily hydrolase (TIGR01509 family)
MHQWTDSRAVIFDMDGVLTDSEPLINAAAIAMFKEQGLVVQPEDFLPFVGAGEDRYIGGVAEKHHFPLDLPAAKRRTYEIYLQLVPVRLRAFPGARELVAACRRAGLRVAVASSADRVKIAANLAQIGLPLETWDAAIVGEEVVAKKPAPEIFLSAAARLGLAPRQCVVVEDAVNGVLAAKAAGMRCVAVAQTFPPDQLRAADLVRPDIAAVSVADLVGRQAPSSDSPAVAPPSLPLPSPPASSAPEVRWWGFWATLGLSVAVFVAWSIAQVPVIAFWLCAQAARGQNWRELRADDGLLLSLAILAAAPVTAGLTWLFAWVRARSASTTYLGFRPVAPATLLRWSLVLLPLLALADTLTYFLHRPIVPDFMVHAYRTAGVLPLLWLVVILVSPVMEEMLFRGFLFEGIRHSRLGPVGAIVLSSLAWALIHLQYNLYEMSIIFVGGLLLGYARLRTQSIVTTIWLHSLMNLLATLEVALLPDSLLHRATQPLSIVLPLS